MSKITSLCLILFTFFSFAQDKREIGSRFIKTLLIDKNAENAHLFFDASVSGQIPVEVLRNLPEEIEGQLGTFKNILQINNERNAYYFYSEFEKTKLDIQINFSEENKIVGFFLVPHKTFEKADDATALNIKSDNIELKGTLLHSKENDYKRLVIFVHGSGPQDRDETVGDSKPFKDIAEYLHKNGISSYRYDKRTYSNPETFNEESTVKEEIIDDAVNITNYFKNKTDFKDYQIILLGHSQGAYLMPQIAKEANVSKYIFLAGNSRPLQDVILEQFKYINKLDSSDISDKAIINLKKEIALLNSDKFNSDTKSTELPMGLSAKYWKYLLDYKPLETIRLIKVPMFFAQGSKDYQVTEKDFNLWKNQLKSNKAATFKLYPSLNHLFIESTNIIPSPKDYEVKGNVDKTFLEDLKIFIMK